MNTHKESSNKPAGRFSGLKGGLSKKLSRVKEALGERLSLLAEKIKEAFGKLFSHLGGRRKPKIFVPKFRAEPLAAVIEGDILDRYSIDQAVVVIVDNKGKGYYLIQEPSLTAEEQRIYSLLMENLYFSLRPTPISPEDPMRYVEKFIYETAEELGILKEVHKSFQKYRYYIARDAFGYGPIQAIMNDPRVEEVSCVGYGTPISVIHRDFTQYDWLETNVTFISEEKLKSFVQKLAQRANKSVTVAIPFIDMMTRRGHRVAVTFSDEVTLPGSSFSIRKFPEDPLSMAHIIKNHTLSPLMAAYLWMIEEYRGLILVLGPMSSGKSVAGYEPTLVLKEGIPTFSSFSQLWKDIKRPIQSVGQIQFKNPGLSTVGLLPGGYDWMPVTHFIKHEVKTSGIRIILRDGREITTTLDHSLIVLNNKGQVVTKTPDMLTSTDYLPVIKKLVLPEKAPTLSELIEMLGDTGKLFIKSAAISHIWKNYPITKKRLAKLIGYKSAESLRQKHIRLEAAKRAWNFAGETPETVIVTDRGNHCEFNLRNILSLEFAGLLGYYIAEGYGYGWDSRIFQSDGVVSDDMLATAKHLSLLPNYIRPKDRVPYINLSIIFTVIARKLGCGTKAENKSLPSIYWRMPKEWKRELLKKYFSGDGTIDGNDVSVTTKSFKLARQLMVALLEFGILARRRDRIINGRKYYEVTIPSYFIREYLENISFVQPTRVSRLVKIANRQRIGSQFDTVPNCLLQKHLSEVELLAKRGYRGFDLNVNKGYAVSKKNLIRVLRKVDHDKTLMPNLWQLATDNIAWIPVKKLEKIQINDPVFDFSTPESETFLAGEGIIVHNTTLANCLLSMLSPSLKIATIEDTPELRIPHKSWERFKARHAYSITTTKYDVDLFDLIKLSLRYRPDYIAVGEIRGEEAKALIQAASLGHGCISTLHAEGPKAAFIRLTTSPMGVERGSLLLVWALATMHRVRMPTGETVRRLVDISEIIERKGQPAINKIFYWRKDKDEFFPSTVEEVVRKSERLKGIATLMGWTREDLIEELTERADYLKQVVDERKLSYAEFSEAMRKFYAKREQR